MEDSFNQLDTWQSALYARHGIDLRAWSSNSTFDQETKPPIEKVSILLLC